MRLVKPPKRSARERLANISHHFLSDGGGGSVAVKESSCQGKGPLVFALYDRCEGDLRFPLYSLCQHLAELDVSTAMLDIESSHRVVSFIAKRDDQTSVTVHDGLHIDVIEGLTKRDEGASHDAYVLHLDSLKDLHALQVHKLIMSLPVNDVGAHQFPADLGRCDFQQFGIIINGVPNRRFAELVFNRMQSNFHGKHEADLRLYGYLPAQDDNTHQLEHISRLFREQVNDWKSRA